MRELKFRGWADSGFVYFDIREDNDFAFHDFCCCCNPDNIEQYTGLKDKNGKEIYEGDIVRWSYRIDRHYEKQFDNMAVKWFSGEYEHYPYSTESGFSLPESEDGYEVIGNIHENPELLGEEQ